MKPLVGPGPFLIEISHPQYRIRIAAPDPPELLDGLGAGEHQGVAAGKEVAAAYGGQPAVNAKPDVAAFRGHQGRPGGHARIGSRGRHDLVLRKSRYGNSHRNFFVIARNPVVGL